MLTVIDEYSRECLAILVDCKLNSNDVVETLFELFLLQGAQDYIRSDSCAEFTENWSGGWMERLGAKTLFIEPGSPCENG
jgi:transposase InsO family protein